MRWKLVPKFPTPGMTDAMTQSRIERRGEWFAALAAAPPASQDVELEWKMVNRLLEADQAFRGFGPAEYWPYMARAILKTLEGEVK